MLGNPLIGRARELGKIAALISNLRSNASVSESTGKLSHDYTPKESTEWIF